MAESVSSLGSRTKYKVVFLGDQGAGKSSIIDRFVNDRFDEGINEGEASALSLEQWQALYDENKTIAGHTVVCGNKIDLQDAKEGLQIGRQFAKKHGLLHFEVSAKFNRGIAEMFNGTVALLSSPSKSGSQEQLPRSSQNLPPTEPHHNATTVQFDNSKIGGILLQPQKTEPEKKKSCC